MSVVLIVPKFGKDIGPFMQSASQVLSSVYNNNGVIFKANALRGANGLVGFTASSKIPKGSSSNYIDCMQAANRYIVLSHMGLLDGPILGDEHGSSLLDVQPWGVDRDTGNLQMAGAIHWTTVGRSRNNKVTIILLGCDSAVSYGKVVARQAGSTVWGFADTCPSGVPEFSVKAVKSIEAGNEHFGLRRIGRKEGDRAAG